MRDSLFDHLIRAAKQRDGEGEAECLGGLHVMRLSLEPLAQRTIDPLRRKTRGVLSCTGSVLTRITISKADRAIQIYATTLAL
jgi:hypothetical protein